VLLALRAFERRITCHLYAGAVVIVIVLTLLRIYWR
jgi:hypothetical protein